MKLVSNPTRPVSDRVAELDAEGAVIGGLLSVLAPLRMSGGKLALLERSTAIVDRMLGIDPSFPLKKGIVPSLEYHTGYKASILGLREMFEKGKRDRDLPLEYCVRCVKCGKAGFFKIPTSEDIPEEYIPWLQDSVLAFEGDSMKFNGVVPSICPICAPASVKLPLPRWQE